MDKKYIFPSIAIKKLRIAKNLQQITYIYGATGFGKTELIKQFLKNKEYDYKSCLENENLSKISKEIAIIDDIQFLGNEIQKQQIVSLMENTDIWLILIGRSSMPNWLLPFHIKNTFLLISEKDLSLSKDDISKYLLMFDITLSNEDLETFSIQSQGNAYAVNQTIIHLLADNHIDDDTMKFVEKSFVLYLEYYIFPQWDNEILDFLTQISIVDEFNVQLEEYITGNYYTINLI